MANVCVVTWYVFDEGAHLLSKPVIEPFELVKENVQNGNMIGKPTNSGLGYVDDLFLKVR